MSYDVVIFDFDGTLIELSEDLEWLYEAVRRTLRDDLEAEFSVHGLTDYELTVLAGLDGVDRFEDLCSELGLDPETVWKHVADRRAVNKLKRVRSGKLHLKEDTMEVLDRLEGEGVELAIVSNGPENSVNAILDYFDIRDRFEYVRGIEDEEDLMYRKPHPNHIKEVTSFFEEQDSFLYVGDSMVDKVAAEKASIDVHRLKDRLDEVLKYY